eukprot:445270_1
MSKTLLNMKRTLLFLIAMREDLQKPYYIVYSMVSIKLTKDLPYLLYIIVQENGKQDFIIHALTNSNPFFDAWNILDEWNSVKSYDIVIICTCKNTYYIFSLLVVAHDLNYFIPKHSIDY